jgi:Na+/H+-translocating membrane pyrophosphatase
LGVAAFAGTGVGEGIDFQLRALMLPLLLAAAGIGFSIWGVYLVKTDEDTSQKNLLKALGKGINYSSVAHLSKQFKSVTGITLSQYKATQLKERNRLDKV